MDNGKSNISTCLIRKRSAFVAWTTSATRVTLFSTTCLSDRNQCVVSVHEYPSESDHSEVSAFGPINYILSFNYICLQIERITVVVNWKYYLKCPVSGDNSPLQYLPHCTSEGIGSHTIQLTGDGLCFKIAPVLPMGSPYETDLVSYTASVVRQVNEIYIFLLISNGNAFSL